MQILDVLEYVSMEFIVQTVVAVVSGRLMQRIWKSMTRNIHDRDMNVIDDFVYVRTLCT